jgi:catabolite regulation protein CreA
VLLEAAPPTVLNRFLASVAEEAVDLAAVVVVEGRVVVREVEVEEVGRVVDVVVEEVSLPTGLVVDVAVRDAAVGVVVVFLSKLDPATLDLRSRVEEDLSGARVEVVPAIDIRLAVPEMPRFSSPELAIDRGFSSAELLTEGRER